jgi:hypothetical protein
MKEIEFVRTESKTVTVSEVDVSECVKWFRKLGWVAESVGDEGVVGICENCNHVILDNGEKYHYDSEGGVYLCDPCIKEMKIEDNSSNPQRSL